MPSAPPSATWYGTDPEIDYAQPQFIVKDPGGETPSDLAKMWIALMVKQVRRYDPDRLISFGSLPVTATANYAFAVEGTAPLLGVVTPHLYPKTEVGLDSAVATLRRFSMTGKPVILGETFQLHSSWQMVSDMLVAARSYLDGVFVYFDGRTADEARDAEDTLSGMYANALDGFTALRSTLCQNRCGVY